MAFANCKKCNTPFKQVYSPYCTTCYRELVTSFSRVYRFLQDKKNNSLPMEAIAKQCKIPLPVVEELFYTGQLGTASLKIVYHCQRCSDPIPPLQRNGRFCLGCTEKIEHEFKAGSASAQEKEVNQKELNFQDAKRRKSAIRKQQTKEMAHLLDKEHQDYQRWEDNYEPPVENPQHYGFKRKPLA